MSAVTSRHLAAVFLPVPSPVVAAAEAPQTPAGADLARLAGMAEMALSLLLR